MKIILLLAVVGAALDQAVDCYKIADDNLDMEAVVNDPSKLKAMTDCFLDRNECDAVAESIKFIVAESIARACDRCNDAQKHLGRVYVSGLFWKRPGDFKIFVAKYDPEGNYLENFMKAVADY
ncbi:ejaculatory bulb-specific protein 3-like [Pieris brassicae]|uniref:Chemosensory protein n=1 Tax=Pieris brassicae TaxID=7116 RepID=A0A9P0TF99_PIEBR|nr:ejaculatory bulb-specific protein 3-like [Pieris brassicae]CAH4030410.1 unnamed protein product [Pieris brassicae]